MLFSSYTFVFLFLPVALAGFDLLCRPGRRPAVAWLLFVWFAFHAWWNLSVVVLLAISISVSYLAGEAISATKTRPRVRNAILGFAIAANLMVLVYRKHVAGVIDATVSPGLTNIHAPDILCLLVILFLTFIQIGYLVDIMQSGDGANDRFSAESLAVTGLYRHGLALVARASGPRVGANLGSIRRRLRSQVPAEAV